LLELGANPNRRDRKGRTPLFYATSSEWRSDVIERMLKVVAEIDAKDEDGRTPLSVAAEGGEESTVKLLLKAGADSNALDSSGRTPTSFAAAFHGNGWRVSNYVSVLEALLDNGGNVNIQDNTGMTPLDYASHQEVVKLLRERGATRNKTNEEQVYVDITVEKDDDLVYRV
jgi:ankyrin repeat protein